MFKDPIFRTYTSQDDAQAAAAKQKIVEQLHWQYLKVRKAPFNSDNVTFFLLQKPYSFHL